MNKNTHRLVFNKSRGCTMAVAETASSCTKSPSGTSKARRRSSKCFKAAKSDGFSLLKVPLAQWIRAQAAIDLIANFVSVNITAKRVDILEARETSTSTTAQKFKQTGLTVSVSSPVIAAVSQGQAMAQAASNTSDTRMKALAAASTALNVYNNAKDIGQAIADPVGSASINVSLGSSKSQSNTAKGSTLAAGNNINITATGADKSAGQQSDVTIQGSSITAGASATLTADNQINLLGAKNEASAPAARRARSQTQR